MLENIISLSEILTRQKTSKVEVIDEVRNSNTKIGKLYENVANGNITTEEDAVRLLGYNGIKDKNYANLKGKLYKRMINSIFFLDQRGPNYQDIFNAGKNCYKNYAALKILLANRKRKVAIDLAKKTLRISIKYEFTDLNYLLSAILTSHLASYTTNVSKYNYYRDLREFYFNAINAEHEAEELYGLFGMSMLKSSRGISDSEKTFHEKSILKLRNLQTTITTTRFNLFTYLYQANYFLEFSKYEDLISIAEEGIEFYKQKGIKSYDADYTLRTRSAMANFLMGNYDIAEVLFKKNLEITSPKTSNWFSTYNFLFALFITKAAYLKSYEVLVVIFTTKEFESTLSLLIQLFKIKEAYIHFLLQLGKIDPSESKEKPLRRFRLKRFLNDVPTYSKDKRGGNISILIIQMLLLVQNKKHGEILDKLDALNMYSYRYLRSDRTFRSNCFIKMLAKLPDADYHPIRWERYVKKFRQRLDEHPFELSYHNLDLEVIPFETLYDLVVEMLYKQKGIKR